jgi:uncharacterized protein YceK
MRTLLTTALLASLAGVTGCGTLLNVGEKDERPYGGVGLDAKIIAQGVPLGPAGFLCDIDIPSFWPLALMDIPLSLVADTLTLPITIAAITPKQPVDQSQSGQPSQTPSMPSSP